VKLQAENDDDTQDDTTEHDEHQYSDMELQIDEKVGYDGQLIPDYGKWMVSIISNHVLTRIASLSREYVLSFWGITSAGKRSEMGHIVENLFWQDLQKPYLMKTFLMTTKEETEEVIMVKKCKFENDISLDHASLGKKVFNATTSVVAQMQKNMALIDFAGPGRKVYQVTVSPNHTLSIDGLKHLFVASGHLKEGKDHTLQVSKNAKRIGKISYYWVVPESRATHWKKKAPRSIRKDPVVSQCLHNFVDQYVLVMDTDPKTVD
jgi:hypothetical protein